MNPETEAWVSKAEGDWRTMSREFAVLEQPNYNAICFHAQQCAEKYLKSRLVNLTIPFPKIHDLQKLLNMLLPSHPNWQYLMDGAAVLSALAVEVRYPGMDALKSDAERSVEYCELFRIAVRHSLDLSV